MGSSPQDGASLLIKGGRVIDPASGLDREADVLIEGGRVARIDRGIATAAEVIEARGALVVPGLIDIDAHLREPGHEYKEDIASGTRAAVAGGFTAVCCMADTDPPNDTRAVTELITGRAREHGVCRVFPVGAVSRGRQGRALCEYADMKEAGIVAVSDAEHCVTDAGLLRRALEYAATFDLPLLQHCEDPRLAAGGAMHEELIAHRTGIKAQPPQAESSVVARDVELVELTRAHYHALHLSSVAALRCIRDAKARGLPVSCSVTPLHYTLTDEACLDYDSAAKVRPPLRSSGHLEAVKQGVADGTVDAIASGHAPQSTLEKEVEFGLAGFGSSALETTLPLVLDLWRQKVAPLGDVLALVTDRPAQLMGLALGRIEEGGVADVTVIDPDHRWKVDGACFASRSPYTPLAGRELRGVALATVVGGRVRHRLESPDQSR